MSEEAAIRPGQCQRQKQDEHQGTKTRSVFVCVCMCVCACVRACVRACARARASRNLLEIVKI